jgi:hypothetical protein
MAGIEWQTLRALSTTDDTGLAADACTWDSVTTNQSPISLKAFGRNNHADHAGMEILFYGTDAADETMNWNLYLGSVNGPFINVAYGTATLGLTETGATNTFYADTIAISSTPSSQWPGSVTVKSAFQYNLGTGSVTGAGIAYLWLDTREYDWALMLMDKNSSAASIGADYRLLG